MTPPLDPNSSTDPNAIIPHRKITARRDILAKRGPAPISNKRRKVYNAPMHKNKINRAKVVAALNTICPSCGHSISPAEVARVDLSGCDARSADQFLRQADRLALTLAVSNCRGFWNKNGQNARPHRAGHPPRQVFALSWPRTEGPGRNPNSGQRLLRARRSRAAFSLGPLTKRGHIRNSDILAPHHVAD